MASLTRHPTYWVKNQHTSSAKRLLHRSLSSLLRFTPFFSWRIWYLHVFCTLLALRRDDKLFIARDISPYFTETLRPIKSSGALITGEGITKANQHKWTGVELEDASETFGSRSLLEKVLLMSGGSQRQAGCPSWRLSLVVVHSEVALECQDLATEGLWRVANDALGQWPLLRYVNRYSAVGLWAIHAAWTQRTWEELPAATTSAKV